MYRLICGVAYPDVSQLWRGYTELLNVLLADEDVSRYLMVPQTDWCFIFDAGLGAPSLLLAWDLGAASLLLVWDQS